MNAAGETSGSPLSSASGSGHGDPRIRPLRQRRRSRGLPAAGARQNMQALGVPADRRDVDGGDPGWQVRGYGRAPACLP